MGHAAKSEEGRQIHMGAQVRVRLGANWKGSPQLIAALVFICLSVFVWGLRYKLSLYDSPRPIGARVPAAKLLSPKERPPVAAQLAQLSSSRKLLHIVWQIGENPAISVATSFSILAITRPPIQSDGLWYDASVDSRPPPVQV
jgi:hypothetical protein